MSKARRFLRSFLVTTVAVVFLRSTASPIVAVFGQAPGNPLSVQAQAQIGAVLAEKAALTPNQRKINSRLLHAKRRVTGETRVLSDVTLPRSPDGRVQLELRAEVTSRLLASLSTLRVTVIETQSQGRSVLVDADLSLIEQIAALPDVYAVQPKPGYMTSRSRPRMRAAFAVQGSVMSVGSAASEGDVTHGAAAARTSFGFDGTGIKVGVISDGVSNLASAQSTGNLGSITVLAGQAGSGDEGTAMLEIVHDLAPGAQLFFATALDTPAQFAQNIRNLRAAGCNIIIDDVKYFVESPFQDGQAPFVISPTSGGVVAQAVKDVADSGALYFSSAGNSGNQDDGTSGTWEGDFVDGGPASIESGRLHSFGANAFNAVTSNTGPVSLHWSDPLGASANDYDIFIFDSTGTTLFDFSADSQVGTQDPVEIMGGAFTGERIVIVKFSGANRFFHLDTNRGRLAISTPGNTAGHAATSSVTSFGVAATPAAVRFGGALPAGPFPNPFNSTNRVEVFSSDGPRRIFFSNAGAAITPGNVSSTGGQLLQKPDIAAADGVAVSGAGGFATRFFGTSAAAPHAGAIAALVMSARPGLSAPEVRTALLNTAIDIHSPGSDRNSGIGIIMADSAIAAVLPLRITASPASQIVPAHTTAVLTVLAEGLPPLTYQWHQGLTGTLSPIAGATSSTFVTPPLDGTANYWVRVSNSNASVDSTTATVSVTFSDPTHSFTDSILTTGLSIIRAVHILELRTRIDVLRNAAGLGNFPWTDPTLPSGTVLVKPIHITELREAVTAVYTALGLPPPAFTGSITSGSVIRAQHIGELRDAVTAREPTMVPQGRIR